MPVNIQRHAFNVAEEYEQLRAAAPCGAIVIFTGLVRDFNQPGEPIDSLTLQHYPGMTERLLEEIVEEARQRWALGEVRVVHRVGTLYPGDEIVLVGVSAAHRDEAFAAASFIMDYLKTRATFWKKTTSAGASRWLDMKASDQRAARRWRNSKENQP